MKENAALQSRLKKLQRENNSISQRLMKAEVELREQTMRIESQQV